MVVLLTGVVSSQYKPQSELGPHHLSMAYASHGLQAYVDPDTGQYGRPPEPSVDISSPATSAQVYTKGAATVIFSEQASAKSGGGYAINMRERFRPSRIGP